MIHDYLPVCREDMDRRGWDACDFVYVSGDAVDPSIFGHAIISRLLKPAATKWASLPSRTGKNPESIRFWENRVLVSGIGRKYGFHGKPLFGFKKAQTKQDSYTPGGEGKRPDYATSSTAT